MHTLKSCILLGLFDEQEGGTEGAHGSAGELLLYQGETKLGLFVPARIYQEQLPFTVHYLRPQLSSD